MTRSIGLAPEVSAANISDAVKNGTPFSYIRYNDGEAMFFDNQPLCENRLFGGRFPEPFRSQLKEDMLRAYANADIIGLADERDRGRDEYFNQALEMRHIQSNARLGSVFDIYEWHEKDLFGMMFVDKVTIITCYNLCEGFVNHGWPKPELYPISGTGKGPGVHLYEYHRFRMRPHFDGLWLVSWGLLGKAACGFIKDHGGVAVDIGAIADAWAGRKTRSPHKDSYKIC
jgi:hypothetical protein